MSGLKVHDVAIRLNVSEKTVYKWLQQGLIPASRIGKTWIITEDSVSSLLNPRTASSIAGIRTGTNPAVRSISQSVHPNSAVSGAPAGLSHLKEALQQFESILSGAVEHGISGILGPRRIDAATPAAIAEELENTEGEVLLQGVGLREFFGDKDHATIIRRMAAEDRRVSIRALLVNPTGQFARARTVAEDGERFADDALFRAGPLFGDSWRSLNVIAALKRASKDLRNFSLDVRFLDHWPSTYLVLTRNCAFVETYHFGRPEGVMDGTTIDGQVPMLQVRSGSRYHDLLRNHFDYLWSGRNPFVQSRTLEQVAESVQVQV
ncbi:MAG: helix-turn-helix domain-containing protein [Chloroflexi bacterium]|nr:helix-turn-helix domain-containing protein [Chloroflexota bacterium]